MPYSTALEPDALVGHFLAHPPRGFSVGCTASGLPSFLAPFDLLTTADDALRRRVCHLPFYARWGRLLRWRTRFVGCTVSEYAPLPAQASPEALARELLDAYGRERALLIVKDLPQDSPLLEPAANAQADAFATALAARGFVLLEGMPLAWVPIDFASTDDYLARLPAARRKDIRRKLRARANLDVEALPTGAPCFADAEVIAQYYALYLNVHAQSTIHFDLLEQAFFARLLQDAASGGLVFAYRHGGRLIGWNLCYVHAGKLVDKFVGFAYPDAREHNLYAVSWMHNLDYARTHGLSHYVAGWTDPQVKAYLGAQLSLTRHAVYLRNPLLRALFRRLARHFQGEATSPAEARA
ncbi:MAG TPA: GNAT family N-acetyltransferase [Frateuria sp.]|uniref:GNAT family N-acetyltransferase n=1 Tax=Frateuria sp. TaxID=2211372 RepID=UPI002D7EC6BB|nr:GNAT family N-acetyltransferase [Frateuria sp.]HET6803959.1 GNAT family N-acetyltransferase [Frateuria sp.]